MPSGQPRVSLKAYEKGKGFRGSDVLTHHKRGQESPSRPTRKVRGVSSPVAATRKVDEHLWAAGQLSDATGKLGPPGGATVTAIGGATVGAVSWFMPIPEVVGGAVTLSGFMPLVEALRRRSAATKAGSTNHSPDDGAAIGGRDRVERR